MGNVIDFASNEIEGTLRIVFFRSRISLYPVVNNEEITTKGLGNYFVNFVRSDLVRSGVHRTSYV